MLYTDSIAITSEFRSRVQELVERVGPVAVVADARWQSVVTQLEIASNASAPVTPVTLVVGSPAQVLKQAAREDNALAFVMPVAQLAKWWQRVPAWRDDATLDLWRAGWTPLTIDRVTTANEHAPLEFVIGSARPTPTGSALQERPG